MWDAVPHIVIDGNMLLSSAGQDSRRFLQTLVPFYQTAGTTSPSNHSFAEYNLKF
jgi:hypothetical protein